VQYKKINTSKTFYSTKSTYFLASSSFLKKNLMRNVRKFVDPYGSQGPPQKRIKTEIEEYKLKWHPVDPPTIHANYKLSVTASIVRECYTRVVSHLTKNDILLYDEKGNLLELNPEFKSILQEEYKTFVRDAYEAYITTGVVPMVMVRKNGMFYPKVLEPRSYVLRVSYCVETEEKKYQVLRPIHFVAFPDKLKGYEKDSNVLSKISSDGGYMGTRLGSGEMDLMPEIGMETDIANGRINSEGWVIDPTIKVFDIFGAAPGVFGEVKAPLTAVLTEYNLKLVAIHNHLLAEERRLNPYVFLEKDKETNAGVHFTKDGKPTGDFSSGTGSNAPKRPERSDPFSFSIPVPEIATLSQREIEDFNALNRKIEQKRLDLLRKGAIAAGGGILQRHYERMILSSDGPEKDLTIKYAPSGYHLSNVNANQALSNAGKEMDAVIARFDQTVCASLHVPYSLVRPGAGDGGRKAAATSEVDIAIFRDMVRDKARVLSDYLTKFFRDSFREVDGGAQFANRLLSYKVSHIDHDRISRERNKQDPGQTKGKSSGGYLEGVLGSRKDASLPVMIPEYLAVPTVSPENKSAMLATKEGSTTTKPKNKKKNDMELDGPPMDALAEVANERTKRDTDEYYDKIHNQYYHATNNKEEHSTNSSSSTSGSNGGGKQTRVNLSRVTLRIQPGGYLNMDELQRAAEIGAISPEEYQANTLEQLGLCCQGKQGGMKAAKVAAEFFAIIQGKEEEHQRDLQQKDDDHKKTMERERVAHSEQKELMKLGNAQSKENGKSTSSSGSSSSAKKSSSGGTSSSSSSSATTAKKSS
jgi:hypothetical protein